MCVGEQAPKSSKYDFSKIYIQNYKNQKILGRVRWVRWVRQLVEALILIIMCLQRSFLHASEIIILWYKHKYAKQKFLCIT